MTVRLSGPRSPDGGTTATATGNQAAEMTNQTKPGISTGAGGGRHLTRLHPWPSNRQGPTRRPGDPEPSRNGKNSGQMISDRSPVNQRQSTIDCDGARERI